MMSDVVMMRKRGLMKEQDEQWRGEDKKEKEEETRERSSKVGISAVSAVFGAIRGCCQWEEGNILFFSPFVLVRR